MFIAINKTLENIKYWLEDIHKHCELDPLYILIANKIDLKKNREISTAEGMKIAKIYNMQYYEVSALTGENISDMFYSIAETIAFDDSFNMIYNQKPSIKISDAKQQP